MNLIEIIEKGGFVILPLLVLSIISIAMTIDILIVNIKSFININKIKKNQNIKLSFDPVSKIFNNHNFELFEQEINKIERKTNFLSIIAAISPLLGLLGTVLGMIKIFNVVSSQNPDNPIQALSSGISEALIATAAGLIVAIITALSYYFLISSIDSIYDKVNYLFNLNKDVKN
jgi:biopolymer transport protein ExbB